jgi:acyl transferase domain-containing protein
MAGRFPGASNITEFWENLKNGVESISFFSEEELEENISIPKTNTGISYVPARAVLAGVEYFDASFFNFTPNEAEITDPQLRMFMECSWHALEDAGYDASRYDGAIGVYAGNSVNHYWIARTMFSPKYALLGAFKSELLTTHFSTRVSYHLNLKGPSMTIQTACSTSLVTIHTACIALLSSECDMALAGGVGLGLPQASGYYYMEGMVSSPDGHCRAFDASAEGTVPGSGVGVVLLKRLEDAVDDGDHIYAVIKGTAINNDGCRKVGYMAPSPEGQTEAIRAAYIMAEVEPRTIHFIETHGTGTPLGDPVEIEALNTVFCDVPKQSIAIGAVKSNVGHLDSAAGVTGFIKTVLSLKHRQIPPSLHFSTPNPKIAFKNTPFYVNTGLENWNGSGSPFRAAVSSFGQGGTNAHAILEEWPPPAPTGAGNRSNWPALFLLSARSRNALDTATRNLARHLQEHPEIDPLDAAYTLQVGRKVFAHRRMVFCPSASLEDAVDVLSKGGKKVKNYHNKIEERPAVFLLSGQGAQYVEMGADLYREVPFFREQMDSCFGIVKPLTGIELKDILYPAEKADKEGGAGGSGSVIDRTDLTQPIVFIFTYALARLLMKWGIQPAAMIGYSMGEYIAACLSGVFSLEDALKVVTARGQLMQTTAEAAMLSVPLPQEELLSLLTRHNRLSLAIINGSTNIVTGPREAVETFEQEMKEKRLVCVAVNMGHAVHSPLMEPIRLEFENRVGAVRLNVPQIPYISNVSGYWITQEEAVNPTYWGRHLCNTVRFSDGIDRLLTLENAVFIEIGPGRLLSNILRQQMRTNAEAAKGKHIVNIVKHYQEKARDDYYLYNRLGELWLYGLTVNWEVVYENETEKPNRLPLPGYPFERRRYWPEKDFRLDGMPTPVQQAGRIREQEVVPPPTEEVLFDEPGDPEEYEYEAPSDELEEVVAALWREYLGFERISIHDNFFEINGDSLTATQLITKLQQTYPVEISLQIFFEDPTIAHLAAMVKELLVEKIKNLSEEELEKLAGTL